LVEEELSWQEQVMLDKDRKGLPVEAKHKQFLGQTEKQIEDIEDTSRIPESSEGDTDTDLSLDSDSGADARTDGRRVLRPCDIKSLAKQMQRVLCQNCRGEYSRRTMDAHWKICKDRETRYIEPIDISTYNDDLPATVRAPPNNKVTEIEVTQGIGVPNLNACPALRDQIHTTAGIDRGRLDWLRIAANAQPTPTPFKA